MRTCSKSTGCRVATSTTKPQTSSSFDNLIFEPRHIRAEDIPEDQDKTPDFKLLKDGALRAYCEMKAPTDGDLFDVPDDLAPGEIRTEVRKDPTIFNLARHIAKAAKQLHYARVGVTAKTLANHRSNARAALRWFGREHDVPQRGLRLSARWARFCDRIDARMRDASTAWCAIARLAVSTPRRSMTGSSMNIGTTAPRPRRGPQTIQLGALWSERGMRARLQSINRRCGG
jgi:hypothetical protein